MGQMTYGVLWGIKKSTDVDLTGEDGDGGLLGDWKVACAPRIRAWTARREDRVRRDGEAIYIPSYNSGSNERFYGFWIAVGASGKRGIPDLGSVAFGDIDSIEPYASAYDNARRRWRRFAKWAVGRGVALPKARLFLAETEVA